MPKYIMILSSEVQIPDDEFREYAEAILNGNIGTPDIFKLLEAMNLEGLREELWKRKEELKIGELPGDLNQQIEDTFDEISELFKLGD